MFDLTPPGEPPDFAGIGIKGSRGLRFENLTIQGAPSETATNQAIGVLIETVSGASTTGIIFENVAFRWCKVAVRTADTNNNSELSFYDCLFNENLIGFQCLNHQALVHKFIGCVGGGNAGDDEISSGVPNQYQAMECMFDLTKGGNITVVGFGGHNIETFVKVGDAGGNTGWNLFHNIRLEQAGDDDENTWGNTHRTKLYAAVAAGGATNGQRTEFDGIVITPPGMGTPYDGGTTRFSLLDGHTVVVRNASRAAGTYQFATPASKLVDFPSSGTRGGTIRCFNVQVAEDARLDRADVPSIARYSFTECNDDNVPYPDLLHPPLYGPNYLMSVESHCFALGEGLQGVAPIEEGGGTVTSVTPSDSSHAGVIGANTNADGDVAGLAGSTNAILLEGGSWRFQAAIRVPTASASGDSFVVRVGFGDIATAEPANALYFECTDTVNSGNWRAIVRESGSTTQSITSSVAPTAWRTLEFLIDDAGDCRCFIDGVEIDPAQTLTVPSAALGLLPLQIERTTPISEGNERRAEIDYYKYEFRPTSRGAMYPE
ncbi:MAG: hypothetical protein H6809_01125 [Phycisphaeraceae bacterium]|nr:hypothetical protein [Phycisphaeraceae bacterium]